MDVGRLGRGAMGFTAAALLAVAAGVAWTSPDRNSVLGRVDPSATWQVTFDQGRVGTRFLSGPAAIGAETTEVEMVAYERMGRIRVERLVSPGAEVALGQPVARVSSDLGPDRVAALEATLTAWRARRDLLSAGGRAETIARAEREVEVAAAEQKLVDQRLQRELALSSQGASASAVVADLRVQASAASLTVDARRAALREALLVARPEQLAEAEAAIAAAEADLRLARLGADARDLASPIAGMVARGDVPCDPSDRRCLGIAEIPALLRVVVADPVVVRVAWPGEAPPAVGASMVVDVPSSDDGITANVADVGPVWHDAQGAPFVPVALLVPNPEHRLPIDGVVRVHSAVPWWWL